MKIEKQSADGKHAHLIWCADGKFRLRIYSDITCWSTTSFTDYEIMHSDLMVQITDADATLYTDGNNHWIDHNPDTLGIADETSVEK